MNTAPRSTPELTVAVRNLVATLVVPTPDLDAEWLFASLIDQHDPADAFAALLELTVAFVTSDPTATQVAWLDATTPAELAGV